MLLLDYVARIGRGDNDGGILTCSFNALRLSYWRDRVLRFNEIQALYDRLKLLLVASIGTHVDTPLHKLQRYLRADVAKYNDGELTSADITDYLSQEKINGFHSHVVAFVREDLRS